MSIADIQAALSGQAGAPAAAPQPAPAPPPAQPAPVAAQPAVAPPPAQPATQSFQFSPPPPAAAPSPVAVAPDSEFAKINAPDPPEAMAEIPESIQQERIAATPPPEKKPRRTGKVVQAELDAALLRIAELEAGGAAPVVDTDTEQLTLEKEAAEAEVDLLKGQLALEQNRTSELMAVERVTELCADLQALGFGVSLQYVGA